MKIVHVIIGLDVGGAELMLKRLIEAQSGDTRFEHCVISLSNVGVLGPQLVDAGIPVYPLGMKSLINGPSCIWSLRRLLKSLRPDIVHTWMYHADLLGGIAARSLGIRNIIWCIRSTDIRQGGSKLTLLVRKACAKLSYYIPKVIVCAAHGSRKIHELVGYDPAKMLVIPNGFDMNRLSVDVLDRESFRSSLGIKPDTILVGSIGRFNQVKDHGTFIQAAAQLAENYPNVRFLLVGRGLKSDNLELVQQIESTGFAKRFILLGERSDVPVCLRAMDVFCLHSRTEGFPNVLGEAMAVGLPCVTTDVGDAAYLLDRDEYVVPPSNPAMLSGAIECLLRLGEDRRAELGAISRQRIFEKFTLTAISKQYADLYDKTAA